MVSITRHIYDVTYVLIFKNSKDQNLEGRLGSCITYVYRLNYNMGFVVKCVCNLFRAHTREYIVCCELYGFTL